MEVGQVCRHDAEDGVEADERAGYGREHDGDQAREDDEHPHERHVDAHASARRPKPEELGLVFGHEAQRETGDGDSHGSEPGPVIGGDAAGLRHSSGYAVMRAATLYFWTPVARAGRVGPAGMAFSARVALGVVGVARRRRG